MKSTSTEIPIHQQLRAIFDLTQQLKRDLGHVLDERAPAPWRAAAAAAFVARASELAALADDLIILNAPTDATLRMLVDARARWLRKSVDRLARLWTEKAGRPPIPDLQTVIDELGQTLRRVAK